MDLMDSYLMFLGGLSFRWFCNLGNFLVSTIEISYLLLFFEVVPAANTWKFYGAVWSLAIHFDIQATFLSSQLYFWLVCHPFPVL